ncbi:MAG: Rne/Rng family ribonuclease, partial [Planctomycetes bacterium]|nr:Rne/Rng family ribonuclease [Planctomycetota bacterium]
MSRRILMNVADGDECRIAVIEDGRLFEYFVDRPSQLKHVGNIYKGVIQNVEPGIQAAFVDIGLERNGFLHVSDVLYAYENNPPLTELFPRTLRIREPLPEESMLSNSSEQDVEEVDEFVGTGDVPKVTPPADNGAAPENGAPREAEFLDRLNEPQPGHRLTDSPLVVDPPSPEPMPETPPPAPQAESVPRDNAGDQGEEDDDDEGDDEGDGDEGDNAGGPEPQPGAPVALGPDGQPLRRRRRRGRRGGRRRREAREAAARRAAENPGAATADAGPPADQPAQTAAETTQPPHEPQAEPQAAQPQPAAQDAPAPVDEPQPHPAAGPQASRPPRQKKRRLPKKRGGHLPKRLFEDGTLPPDMLPPESGNTGPAPSGGDGSAPPNGPALRFHRGPLPRIQNLLKRDQEVVVQVAKASQGGKGPGLTSMISLPGRYMVLTPNSQRGGVSRKIEDGGARNELRKILDRLPVPEGMGVIIRTAAINRSFDDLNRDLNYLLRLWNVITSRIAEAPAPALLYSDSDPAIRTVRDYFTAETEEIVIDDRAVYERVLGFFDQLMPSFKDRVKLYDGEVPLFFAEGLEGQIERIFDKKVNLKSGGYLYVEQTEALVSIDVNSGKFTSAGDAERTAYLTNLEAIPEICRQLRLRDLGGIVCCDLIDMMSAKHRGEIENALRRELRKDRARTKVARMSPFGVIELTRQRVRPSIKAYTYVSCPTCNGFGMVHSAETMCLSLIRRMKLALCEPRVIELVVQVHPHVLSHLHSEFREDIDLLEEEFDKRVLFEYARDLTLGQSRFYYVNDRQVRVVYDMDQRINSFVRNEAHKVRSNVAPPPAATGAPGTTFATGERREGKRRRRGGRRQREREQQRLQRTQRIQTEAEKAVSFGADLPELPPMEVIRQPQPAPRPQG